MEVPCCFGLIHAVKKALEVTGEDIPYEAVKIGIKGEEIKKAG